ncbi:MAG: hypothetical protein LLG01_01965 [Planctomycetaceae bacterium]|nr:hypothetical protein [Planctomycetaceae bacterium]
MGYPIVIAHHLIWTVYGYWLPNDPRGSMSRTIRCDVLRELGELHHGRRAVQPASRDIKAFYTQAVQLLRHELLVLDAAARAVVAQSVAETIRDRRYTCWACAIMDDHVHMLLRKHRDPAEEMIRAVQLATRDRLGALGHRKIDHPTWGGPGWSVFQDSPDDVWRTIRYIENNPLKLGWARQNWAFVTPYNNWPLHAGHSPHSPYVRRMGGHNASG